MIEIGKSYEVACPFVRDVYGYWDEEGVSNVLTWKPGVQWEAVGPEDSEPVAHGVGKVLYHVIDVHKLPRPYPTRVFFTRQWINPDGKLFGRKSLRIMTKEAFGRRLSGYRFGGSDYEADISIRDLNDDERRKLMGVA